MVYDESVGRVVLFGGFENRMEALGDTWVFETEAGEWMLLDELDASVEAETDAGIPGYGLFMVLLGLGLAVFSLKQRQFNGL
jgi:hypothetical protein